MGKRKETPVVAEVKAEIEANCKKFMNFYHWIH